LNRRRLILAMIAPAVCVGLLVVVVRGGATASGGSNALPPAVYRTEVNPGNGIQFVSARRGFALFGQPLNSLDGHLSAPAGLVVAWPSRSIIATRDGGRHWSPSLSEQAGFWGVQFTDSRHGWAVGVVALYRTRDGGASWQRVSEPSAPLVRVAFISPAHGFGITVGGRLVESTNGGLSWHASRWSGNGAALCVSSRLHVLVVDEGAGVWSSEDGGASSARAAVGLIVLC
jgi:hypothetical protein